jgi:GNAT superfamily N-acetyltransferase
VTDEFEIRRLAWRDSRAELTELLHRAYAPLAAQGMRYVASHQSTRETRRRIRGGECYVAVSAGRLVATVTLRGPRRTRGCPFYARPEVASFHQFAVDPAVQGSGLGGRLLAHVEARARELGALELAFDTAESAEALLAFYRRRGYRQVGFVQWPTTNYRSVVMSKHLAEPG